MIYSVSNNSLSHSWNIINTEWNQLKHSDLTASNYPAFNSLK